MDRYGVVDVVFQVNDGGNEVGVGWLGTLDQSGGCEFSYVPMACGLDGTS